MEEDCIVVGAFWVTYDFRDCRPDCVAKTPIALIVHNDNGLHGDKELRLFLIGEIGLVGLLVPSNNVAEHRPRIIADDVDVADRNRVQYRIKHVLNVLGVEECAFLSSGIWDHVSVHLWGWSTQHEMPPRTSRHSSTRGRHTSSEVAFTQ